MSYPIADLRHLNDSSVQSEKKCMILYISQENAIMFEYYKGDFFRCKRMVECALQNDRLPARFRATYDKMLTDLDAKKAGPDHATRIEQMAVWYRYTLQDPAIPKAEDEGEVDEKVLSLDSVIAQTKLIDEASFAAKKKLFDELMKVNASTDKVTEGIKKKDSLDIRRAVGHARHSSA